jgi:hypothetical protein
VIDQAVMLGIIVAHTACSAQQDSLSKFIKRF